MPLTLLGSSVSRTFTVRNIGRVPADVQLRLLSELSMASGIHVDKQDSDITIPVGQE